MWSTILFQLRRNWFKLFFIGLLIYIFFKKDLSFQVNMRAPAGSEQISPPQVSRERMSDAGEVEQASMFDRLHLPLFSTPENRVNLTAALTSVSEERRIAYLKRFARVAISERKKFRIPTSLIMASAFYHSSAGTSSLAQEANNHFLLIADENWNGLVYEKDGRRYRMYENAWSCFRDHSEYITRLLQSADRIPEISDLSTWVRLLIELGYEADPNFVNVYPEIIRQYQLQELDTK